MIALGTVIIKYLAVSYRKQRVNNFERRIFIRQMAAPDRILDSGIMM